MKKGILTQYGLLIFALFFYSLSSLCIKMSAFYAPLSIPFILYYGASIAILMLYAVLWQMVLKRVDLSRAYAMKPLTMLISMIWGYTLFHEAITWNMILGMAIILIGIRLVVTSNGE